MAPHLISLPGRDDVHNQDAVALAGATDGAPGTGSVAVVVDGAGLPPELLQGCRHRVDWYSNHLASAFRDQLVSGAPMRDALAAAIATVAELHPECDLAAGSPSATAAAWRTTGDQLEYLVLCDASIILVDRDGTPTQVTDDRLARLVARFEAGRSQRDELLAARAEVLETLRNTDDGFWCCHHDPAAARHALVGQVGLASLRGVVATSDGATRGHELLDCLSLQGFSDLVLSGDATGAARRVREAEDARAAWLDAGGHKQHDDLTIVWQTF